MDSQDTSSGSGADPIGILKAIARSLKSIVTRCNESDANVARMRADVAPNKDAIPLDRFVRQTKAKYRGHIVRVSSNDVFFRITVQGRFCNTVISINRVDRIMLTKDTGATIGNGRLRIYARDSARQCNGPTVLESLRAQELVTLIISSCEDSVHFYANAVVCYLFQPSSSDDVLRVLREMVSLAEDLEVGGGKIERIRLPAQFSDMAPLADRWCISDDTAREEAIEAASCSDLRSLIAKVKPRLADIDTFLSEVSIPADESAALSTLAECAVEAELYLAHRGS